MEERMVEIYDIDNVINNKKESAKTFILSLHDIEDYLLQSHGIELDEDTLETNSHIDMWIRDTTNTYMISGDMWTGIYTFERLNNLEK